MSTLPNPPLDYDQTYFYDLASEIRNNDVRSMKIDGDNVLKVNTGAIILQSPDGDYWRLTVDNSGNLGTSQVTNLDSSGNPIVSQNPYS